MADRALARNAVPWGVAVRGVDAIVKREMVAKWMGFNGFARFCDMPVQAGISGDGENGFGRNRLRSQP